jgi:pimeloyl-ACP methyl ester carboxylesterase
VRKAHRAADLVSALRNPALLHASPRETSSVCLPIPDRLLERFRNLPVPKCFLYGSENRHLSYLQPLRESESPVIEIANAGHFLFYDDPNNYGAALASFARNSCSFSLRESP